MTRRLLILAVLTSMLSWASTLSAQDNSAAERYKKFKKQATHKYEDFRRQANRQYLELLGGEWEEGEIAEPVAEKPQEQLPPMEAASTAMPTNSFMVHAEVVDVPKWYIQPMPLAEVTTTPDVPQDVIDFKLYGTDCKVRFTPGQSFELPDVFQGTLVKAWEEMLTPEYDNTLYDCLALRDQMLLCDWAYLQLLDAFATAALGEGSEAELLKAYLYAQSGYRMRMVTNEAGVHMLFATDYVLSGKSYLELEGTKYFASAPLRGAIKYINVGFPKEQSLSLAINALPRVTAEYSQPTMHSSDSLAVAIAVDKNLLEFYSAYPISTLGDNMLTQWVTYARTPMDAKVIEQLYPALKVSLEGKTEHEAVSTLLNFLHKGFPYKEDPLVWGYERPFFAEETLYYPYCDCEDRAILFSRLVRDLVGLDVALVYYPNHLAAAVKFNEPVKGDYVLVGYDRYIICDPTYINAPVGATIPNLDNSRAKTVVI